MLVLSLFRAFPSYDALGTDFCKAKWRYAQVKCDDPLADTSRIFPAGSHESNLTFRLTVPIVAHALRLRRNGMLFLFGLAGVLLLYTSLDLAHRLTGSRKAALYVCAAIACAWPGEAAFHELRGGYYDAPALCLLLLAFSARSAPSTALFVFLAAWTDERALIASLFLLVFEATQSRTGKAAAILAAGAAYAGTRAYLTAMFSYAGGASGVAFSVFSHQTNRPGSLAQGPVHGVAG